MLIVPPAAAFRQGTSLINTLRNLSLTTNLQVCLDAGDSNSYSSGQTWTDLSGGGNSFYLGTGSGSDAADPTFTGTAGKNSSGEYFSYDGGDRFTLNQAAPSWQSGMHKAGGAFTIVQWVYVATLSSPAPTQAGFGCGDATSSASSADRIGFTNSSSTQNALSIAVTDGASALVVGNKSTLLVTNNAWQMIATAVTIDSGAILFAINGSSETRSNTGSGTPSATDSHVPLVIGATAADGYVPAISGCRIGSTAIWTRALSSTELASLYAATRGKYGL